MQDVFKNNVGSRALKDDASFWVQKLFNDFGHFGLEKS